MFTPIVVAQFAKNLKNRKTSLARTGSGPTFRFFPDKVAPTLLLAFAGSSYMPNLILIGWVELENIVAGPYFL